MILDRLLIRHKLNLLVALPLVTVAVLTMVLLGGQVGQARRAATVADRADGVRRVGTLVREIQQARLLGVGYLDAGLVSTEDLELQLVAVHDTRAQLLRELDPDTVPDLLRAVQGSDLVSRLGALTLGHQVSAEGLIGALSAQNRILIGALQLDQASMDPTGGDGLRVLDALLRADEAASHGGALLLAAAANPVQRAQMISEARVAQGIEQEQAELFYGLAPPTYRELFRQAAEGTGALRLADAKAELARAGFSANDRESARNVFAAVNSQSTLRQLVDVSVAQSVSRTARQTSTAALTRAALLIGLGLVLLSGVILLSVVVGRSVSTPLRRLTNAAGTVVDTADDALSDVADDDSGPAAVRNLAALPATSRDELGELAVAFNRVQSVTARLLERQVVSRRNVAAMFASVGRRTSNLVGRQLALIDTLESAEEDPQTLGVLYRLDHLSTRLRRNASSLVVLSGDRESTADVGAVSLPDAVRAALGSVEEFQRVILSALPEVHLSPGASADIVLILSELIENAVLFSPPHTTVEVAAWVTDDSRYALTVVDHGIGMPPERLAEENARLRQRERLDLAPTDVLGLFVVGRVSRRHGIEITLISTPGGGVTTRIVLPPSLFVENPWSGPVSGLVEGALEPLDAVGRGVPTVVAVPPGASDPAADPVPLPPLTSGVPVSVDRQVGASPVAVPPDLSAGSDPPSGVRRRVPGTHWEGPPPIALRATGNAPAPVDPPAAAGIAQSSGAPTGFVAGVAAGPPDPEATRHQVEDLETALADVPPTPSVPPPPGAPPFAPPDTEPPTGRPGTTQGGLVRRVPGATLAALGAVLPEPDSPAPESQPSRIDADETMRAILDIDEAIRRARAQPPTDGGHSDEGAARSHRDGQETASSPWNSHGNGGGR